MRVLPILAVILLVGPITGAAVASAQGRNELNANDCLVWTGDSLLANAYFQVAKNDCEYAIRIEYRYEDDTGTGCFGARPCTALLQPHEIRRFTAGTIRHWACRPPAVPRFPDIARDGRCE
jgi:hypothetical protein